MSRYVYFILQINYHEINLKLIECKNAFLFRRLKINFSYVADIVSLSYIFTPFCFLSMTCSRLVLTCLDITPILFLILIA